ncbi:Alpha/Beta hydrolase protein [Rhexocercosporidium sp. MPI-PUGE-AT-0058]|nr:Alpha/Beta hydrolase protein [Rhexocercosporidium sp. MPI-PUGE-AT-0058]
MQRFILSLIGLLPLLTNALPTATCNTVQIFIAVGHGESYPGTQKSIANLICAGRTACGTANIDYPSTSSNNYCNAVETGIKNGLSVITAYAKDCPQAKIVLTGWSQGAQVVTDIVSGGGGTGMGNVAKGLVAVSVYGDPRHTATQTFNIGTGSSKNGVWPRTGTQLEAENLWSAKLRSYCADGDIACANGTSTAAHGGYFGNYAKTPANWIISTLK